MKPRWITAEELPNLLATRLGKPLLVNHWATWCVPCVEELPLLGRLFQRFGETVPFLGLSWDRFEPFVSEEQTLMDVTTFVGVHGLGYEMLIFRGSPDEFFTAMPLEEQLVPQTFLYDASGALLFHHLGSLDTPEAEEALVFALLKVTA